MHYMYMLSFRMKPIHTGCTKRAEADADHQRTGSRRIHTKCTRGTTGASGSSPILPSVGKQHGWDMTHMMQHQLRMQQLELGDEFGQ